MATHEPVLYAVCDGEKARFLRYDGGQLRTVNKFDVHSKGTNAEAEIGSVKEPKSDPHVQLKQHFAHDVAGQINEAFQKDTVLAGLVLTAPGHVLHEIRTHLTKAVAAKVIVAEDKDLTNTPDHDILGHFDRPATGWRLPTA